jgi:hypothetical protein
MKSTKIIYWVTTGILAVMMSYSAYLYLTSPDLEQAFTHLGFPGYFRVELAIAKFIGAALLLVPVSIRIKEWVYAGFGIVFISGFIAHLVSGDPTSAVIMPLVFFLLLMVSYFTLHKYQRRDNAQEAKLALYPQAK